MNLKLESDSALSRDPGLAPVRESRTSSSSSSTIKGTERAEAIASRVHVAPSDSVHLQTSQRNLKPPSKFEHPGQTSVPERLDHQRHEEGAHSLEGLEALDSNPLITAQPNRALYPPPRPSREGTPKLDDGCGPSPVIRSNLSRLITTGHKRRESAEKSLSSVDDKSELLSKSRPTLGRSPSNTESLTGKLTRLPSPKPVSGVPSRTRLPDLSSRVRDVPTSEHGASGAPIKEENSLRAVTVKSSARFGFFTRRNKSPLEFAVADSSERTAKKGPAAGTGHEGYGKYARRGRSGSASTSASRGRSTSTSATSNSLARTPTSRKSSITSRGEPEVDDFLRERLTPVVISGGGGIGGTTSSYGEVDRATSEEASSGRPSHEGFESRRTIIPAQTWPAQQPSAAKINDSNLARRGSRVLADGVHLLKPTISPLENRSVGSVPRPTLAARRSLHRSQLFKEAEPLKVPAPINTKALAPPAAVDSYDTMLSAALRTDSTNLHSEEIFEGREGHWLRKKKSAKLLKSPRKWNFFQRSNPASKRNEEGAKPLVTEQTLKEVAVTVARLPESRSVAHYALLDSNDPDDTNSFGNLVSGSPVGTHNSSSFSISREHETDVHKQDHKYSMLLPSPPNLSAEFASKFGPPSPMVNLRPPEHAIATLPLVESAPKPREPRLQQVGRIPRVISKRDHLHIPAPQSFSRPFARTPLNINETPSVTEPNVLDSATRPVLGVQTELIPYHPWGDDGSAKPASAPVLASKGFDGTPKEEFLVFPPRKDSQVSASSSSGGLSFAAAPANIQPILVPGEDEVWNEYDEFLDTVQSSDFFKRSPGSQKGDKPNRGVSGVAPLLIRRDSAAIGSTSLKFRGDMEQAVPALDFPKSRVISSMLTPLQSAEMASTPLSFSDFFAGYGDRNRSSKDSRRESASSGSRYSTRSRISVAGPRASGDNEDREEDAETMASKQNTVPSAQSNLRFSALMTSRWLSFGRVLFSPAHVEIQNNRQGRVLVLDGLGNDDWSFYCALTYPNATVYNLSPFQGTSTTPTRTHEIVGYDSPTNHRQIYHTSIAHPFPFPKGFFTAAVFRFPVASSEAACYNAISECKRVLRPGGFLEMSILDLDMVNMGNRARRAVRTLKVQMQVVDPEVSLKPASDNIQKMLGRRGFENLNRCMVNVPIAGHISDSRAGSSDERDLSLGDMLKDSSEQGDEGITKMVAKVGRWWYTRCYEKNVLPREDMDRGIWADKTLLRECEKRETGLKLLICYAQKPLAPKRRTVSM